MPRTRIPPLNHLRAFEAAARHGSFTRAAAELHVTQGAVSRHVKALEDHVGLELFERTPTGVVLRRAGASYGAALTQALDRIRAATEELVSTGGHTRLVVQGYTSLLMRWLIPRLPAFQLAHPKVDVRLSASSRPADFLRDRVDVAIVYGRGTWPGVRADLLFRDELFPVCSREYMFRAAPLRAPSDLAAHRLLHHNRRSQDWPEWFATAGAPDVRAESERNFEDLSVAHECMLAGMGVAMGQAAYFARELDSGSVVAPFDIRLRRDEGFYLVSRIDQAGTPYVTEFRDWLLSTL